LNQHQLFRHRRLLIRPMQRCCQCRLHRRLILL
jgi:hypothetical protein